MSADALTTMILKRLDAAPRVELTWSDLRSASDSEIAALVDARLLVPSGRAEWTLCQLCDEGHKAAVQYLDSSLAPDSPAYYDCPTAGRDWLSPNQLQKWTATTIALVNALACSIGAHPPKVKTESWLWPLGFVTLGSENYAVCLTSGSKQISDFADVISERVRSAIVLTLATTVRTQYFEEAATALPLKDVLRITASNLALDLERIKTSIKRAAIGPAKSADPIPRFTAVEDYRSILRDGVQYTLTESQAIITKYLHESYLRGTPDVSNKFLLDLIDTNYVRISDVFKTRPANKALVCSVSTGTTRLNVKSSPKITP